MANKQLNLSHLILLIWSSQSFSPGLEANERASRVLPPSPCSLLAAARSPWHSIPVVPSLLLRRLNLPEERHAILAAFWEHSWYGNFNRLVGKIRLNGQRFVAREDDVRNGKMERKEWHSKSIWDESGFGRREMASLLLMKVTPSAADLTFAGQLLVDDVAHPWDQMYSDLIGTLPTEEQKVVLKAKEAFTLPLHPQEFEKFVGALAQTQKPPAIPKPVLHKAVRIAHRCVGGLENSVANFVGTEDAIKLGAISGPHGSLPPITTNCGGLGFSGLSRAWVGDAFEGYDFFFVLPKHLESTQEIAKEMGLTIPILTLGELSIKDQHFGSFRNIYEAILELVLIQGIENGTVSLGDRD